MSKSNTNNTKSASKPSTSKSTPTRNLVAHGGRFTTLNIKGRGPVCAKITKLTDSYVTYFDVNAKVSRKVSRSSIL